MGKVKRKITVLRILQYAFYAVGFPLFVHAVVLASKTVKENSFTTFGYYATVIALAMWAVVIIAQLLMRLICRKNRMTRAVICALITAIIAIAPIAYSDFYLKGKFEAEKTAAEEEGVTGIEHYEHQITNYSEYAEAFEDEVQSFMTVFNLTQFHGKDYNAGGKNTDGSEVTYSKEDEAYYSPNGMYSDGYLFSYKQAVKVLKDYYGNKLAYEAEDKDIDAELAKVIAKLESDTSSDWNKYQKGADESTFAKEGFEYISSSDEYALAYGDEGTAKKYYVTPERLDQILSVIGKNLGSVESLDSLLGIVENFLPDGLDVKSLLNENLDAATILELVNGLEINGQTVGEMLNKKFFGGTGPLTEDALFGLLANYSSYQSPTTYPVFYFIEDDALRTYAYAKYYATVHGGKIGSVLVGAVDPKTKEETVGCIGLSGESHVNPYTGEEMLLMFKKWELQEKLVKDYYPIFAVRECALKLGAVMVFALLASYFFAQKADEQFAKLTLKREGGND